MKRIERPHPVVRIQVDDGSSRGRLWLALTMGGVFFLAVVGYLLWPAVQSLAAPDRARERVQTLEKRVRDLQDENDRLVRELAFLKRSSEIDKKANVALVDALSDREKQAAQTRQELGFYKNMVSKEGLAPGITIRRFEVSPVSGEDHDFSFSLVLSRTGPSQQFVKGSITIRVQGMQGGKSVIMDWDRIRVKKAGNPHFRFQHFQSLEGKLRFPAGFEPENVLVKVLVSGGGEQPVQQSYSWNAIVKGGEEQ